MRKFARLTSSNDVVSSSAMIAIASLGVAFASLAILHVVSPEFSPAWRMISEYGNGQYEWVLTVMFVCWGISTLALAIAIRSEIVGRIGRIGLGVLVAAGTGEIGGGVFDINHDPGHSIAGAIGILGLPVAAVMISISLGRNQSWSSAKKLLMWMAHLTWISTIVLGLTFVLMVVTFQLVDGSLPSQVPQSVPSGVIAWVGWANRLMVLACFAWVATVAWQSNRLVLRRGASTQVAAAS